MDDKSAKGRQAKQKGEAASQAILTDEQVREIRRRYVRRKRDAINGVVALGREFVVSYSAIIAIAKRQNWKYVE